jgi:hypothetical protein
MGAAAGLVALDAVADAGEPVVPTGVLTLAAAGERGVAGFVAPGITGSAGGIEGGGGTRGPAPGRPRAAGAMAGAAATGRAGVSAFTVTGAASRRGSAAALIEFACTALAGAAPLAEIVTESGAAAAAAGGVPDPTDAALSGVARLSGAGAA